MQAIYPYTQNKQTTPAPATCSLLPAPNTHRASLSQCTAFATTQPLISLYRQRRAGCILPGSSMLSPLQQRSDPFIDTGVAVLSMCYFFCQILTNRIIFFENPDTESLFPLSHAMPLVSSASSYKLICPWIMWKLGFCLVTGSYVAQAAFESCL